MAATRFALAGATEHGEYAYTVSTTSRLYSSTVASRAKQITPVLTELGPGRKSSRSSPR